MKETQTWSNRVELLLDNRQVFLLFITAAVVISMVFAMGVVVGKRVNRDPVRPAGTDPLAVLDQLGQDNAEENLTFHEKLLSEKKTTGNSRARASKPEPKDEEQASPSSEIPAIPVPHLEKKTISSPASGSSAQLVAHEIKVERPEKKIKKEVAPGQVEEEKSEGGKGGYYSLQLSSFQERTEAEAFMLKLRKEGLTPYLTPTAIPGRGVWYRIRMGKYRTWEEAVSAKQTFEQKQNVIAYVLKY
jgi:DedD protein